MQSDSNKTQSGSRSRSQLNEPLHFNCWIFLQTIRILNAMITLSAMITLDAMIINMTLIQTFNQIYIQILAQIFSIMNPFKMII